MSVRTSLPTEKKETTVADIERTSAGDTERIAVGNTVEVVVVGSTIEVVVAGDRFSTRRQQWRLNFGKLKFNVSDDGNATANNINAVISWFCRQATVSGTHSCIPKN